MKELEAKPVLLLIKDGQANKQEGKHPLNKLMVQAMASRCETRPDYITLALLNKGNINAVVWS